MDVVGVGGVGVDVGGGVVGAGGTNAAARISTDLDELRNMRLIAAAITGPAMVYTGLEKPIPKLLKVLMVTVGVGIMASNFDKLTKARKLR